MHEGSTSLFCFVLIIISFPVNQGEYLSTSIYFCTLDILLLEQLLGSCGLLKCEILCVQVYSGRQFLVETGRKGINAHGHTHTKVNSRCAEDVHFFPLSLLLAMHFQKSIKLKGVEALAGLAFCVQTHRSPNKSS